MSQFFRLKDSTNGVVPPRCIHWREATTIMPRVPKTVQSLRSLTYQVDHGIDARVKADATIALGLSEAVLGGIELPQISRTWRLNSLLRNGKPQSVPSQ